MASIGSQFRQRTILCGRGRRHAHEGAMPLGVRTFWHGTAQYRTERGAFVVEEGSWFVVNEAQPYAITIDSRRVVESLVVFFPAGWAADAARGLSRSQAALLAEPGAVADPVSFFETVCSGDHGVLPRLTALREACWNREVDDGWLEDQLWDLLHALLCHEHTHLQRAGRLAAVRASTRGELYRRLCRGRDFLRAEAEEVPSLDAAARVACLSPFHFQRSFKTVFGETPHAFAARCRLERARRRVERSEEPLTEIAAASGYASYGAFHRAFSREFGASPSRFRKNWEAPAPPLQVD